MVQLAQTVQEIGSKLPAEKREQITANLANLAKSLEELKNRAESVVVTDHHDKEGMKLAREVRLSIRQSRLDAVNAMKAKREEVKKAKEEYDIEDKVYLKLIQTIEAGLSPLEESLSEKENYATIYLERQKKERLDKRVKELEAQGLLYLFPGGMTAIENASDEEFESGQQFALKKKEDDERQQEELRLKEINDRKYESRRTAYKIACDNDLPLSYEETLAMSDEDFSELVRENAVAKAIQTPKVATPEPKQQLAPPSQFPTPSFRKPEVKAATTEEQVDSYFAQLRAVSIPDWPKGVKADIDRMFDKMKVHVTDRLNSPF